MNKLPIRSITFIIVTLLLTACSLFNPAQLISEIEAQLSSPGQPAESIVQADQPISTQIQLSQPSIQVTQNTVELESTLINLYKSANPAVVQIITTQGFGSGFVYDEQGHIVTNQHVIAGQRSAEIAFPSGERYQGVLVGSDVDSDLAVLKIDDLPAGVSPLSLATPNSVQVGQIVVAIGNPFDEQGSMSMGIVSGLGRSLSSQRGTSSMGNYSLSQVIQTDAPINPGNSGGPLLNLSGQVIGVNSAIASTSGSNSGVGFAIPSIAVDRIIPALIQDGKYTYSFMGASFDDEVSLNEMSQYGLSQTQGVYVIQVSEGSPADRAGLIGANRQTGRGGDLIIAIDGQAMNNFSDLNSYLDFNTRPGETIQLTVLRDGKQIQISLILGERP